MQKYLLIGLVCANLRSNAQVIVTIAGTGTAGYSGDGSAATSAQLNEPTGLAIDAAGNVYINDFNNNRVRKINTSGIISTVAGNGTAGFSGDGGLATSAQLNGPGTVGIDALGNLYIADLMNNRIRKVNTSGIISTIAGTGTVGFSGDGGLAVSAQLFQPWGVSVDGSGNIYISDVGNNRVRKINSSGIISTFAGTGAVGFGGDGGAATSATLNGVNGVAFNSSGDVFMAEYGGHRIRKVNSSGTISSVAGNGIAGFSGDGGIATSAQLKNPPFVAVDGTGNLYIADFMNSRIRQVNPSGIISTFAGNGTMGFGGDGGPPGSAILNKPEAIATDLLGNVYIADSYNHRVRKVILPSNINQLKKTNDFFVYPNPTSNTLNLEGKLDGEAEITNYLGQTVLNISYTNSIDISGLAQGLYTLKITSQNKEVYYSKFVKE
jgi:sugar lactone lactonase YvrE